jgi:hypothetical protein
MSKLNERTCLPQYTSVEEWFKALLEETQHRWGPRKKDAAYWISLSAQSCILSVDELLNGWFHVSTHPGANEGFHINMIWEGGIKTNRAVIHFGSIKSDRGFDPAMSIVKWLTLAIYCGIPKED